MNQLLQNLPPDSVYCEELIVCTKKRRGDGKNTPIRIITEVFTKQGEFVAENDPCPDFKFSEKDMLAFADYCCSINNRAIAYTTLLEKFIEGKKV